MENNIVDLINKLNIRLILPIDSDSWGCDWKNCGCCCITEKTFYHIKDKCSKFNTQTKECTIYPNRLTDCKIFPFMVIFTRDGINLSPSLNCPYFLSSVKMNKLSITNVLIEEDVKDLIEGYNNTYRQSFSINKNNIKAENINQINDSLISLTDIKNLEDLKEIISKSMPSDIIVLFKQFLTSGDYIQPNYSIDNVPNPLVMSMRLTKKNHIIFKNKMKTKIIKDMIIPDTVVMNDQARTAFKQYVQLNINRQLEFHSFNICRLVDSDISPENAYAEIWKSNLIYLYIHLILVVLRENVNIIDYPMMREALSMSDSRLASVIYTNPVNPTNFLST